MRENEERWLGPSEAAAKLGVTVKALRVYEREGLVKPTRTAGQWRAYGPAQIARIHMIVVMRELGLSLKSIGVMLDGKTPSLAPLLTAQQEALEQRRRKIAQAIALLTEARLKLAQGCSLSPDDLTQLSRETVMQNFETNAEVEARLKTYLQKRLPDGQLDQFMGGVKAEMAEAGLAKADMMTEFTILIGEMQKLSAAGDPNTEAAKAAVRRWKAVTSAITRPPAEVRKALIKGVDEAMADPAIGPELPFDAGVIAFMREVADGMKARGELT